VKTVGYIKTNAALRSVC